MSKLPKSGLGINLVRNVITLAAGAMQPVQAGGGFLFVESSQGQSFTLQLGQANSFQCKEGFQVPTGTEFPSYKVTNNLTGAAITVVIWTGDEAISYFPVAISNFTKDAPTYTRGNLGAGGDADLALTANQQLLLNGIDAATGKSRRFAVVQNTDAANTIYLLDANKNRMATLKTGSPPYTVVGSGAFYVENGAGAPTNCNINESFYV